MKSLSKGSLSGAVRSLRTNRARSLMTVTGIVIAVVAAIVVVSIGGGVESQVRGQVSRLGKDVITIRPGTVQSRNVLASLGTGLPAQQLGERDVKAVGKVANVRSVTPLALVDGSVSADVHSSFSGNVIGTTSDFAHVLHQDVEFGTFYGHGESDTQMAVIGSNVAADLFEENVPLGRGFSIRGQDFVVIGVLKPFESAPVIGQTDFNDDIFIPYDTAQSMTAHSAPVFEMLVRPDSPKNVDSVVNGLNAALLSVHGGQKTFSVLKQSQSIEITNGILQLMSKLVLAAAATALLVGGVGIMNIMWVSVAERTREIGIRKAVGATSRQILGQFLTEALVLSCVGWLAGAIIALGIIGILHLFSTLQPTLPWAMFGISFLVTLGTGVVFGSIPAFKAAGKDPIDALRNE